MEMELTDPAPEPTSLLGQLIGKPVTAGTYNDGLVTICSIDDPIELPDAWKFLPVGDSPTIYAYTSDAGFFVASTDGLEGFSIVSHSVLAVHLIRGIEGDFRNWFRDEEALDALLSSDRFCPIYERLGPLKYGQCYALEPLLILGGSDEPENYHIRDLRVYLEIVSQGLYNNPLAVPEIID